MRDLVEFEDKTNKRLIILAWPQVLQMLRLPSPTLSRTPLSFWECTVWETNQIQLPNLRCRSDFSVQTMIWLTICTCYSTYVYLICFIWKTHALGITELQMLHLPSGRWHIFSTFSNLYDAIECCCAFDQLWDDWVRHHIARTKVGSLIRFANYEYYGVVVCGTCVFWNPTPSLQYLHNLCVVQLYCLGTGGLHDKSSIVLLDLNKSWLGRKSKWPAGFNLAIDQLRRNRYRLMRWKPCACTWMTSCLTPMLILSQSPAPWKWKSHTVVRVTRT